MHDKLAQLTSKLYDEGVEKGRKEAGDIIEQARKEADAIVKKATHEAEVILQKANDEVVQAKRTANSEIVQAGKSAMTVLKAEIETVLMNHVLSGIVGKGFMDAGFVQSVVLAAIGQFNAAASRYADRAGAAVCRQCRSVTSAGSRSAL